MDHLHELLRAADGFVVARIILFAAFAMGVIVSC